MPPSADPAQTEPGWMLYPVSSAQIKGAGSDDIDHAEWVIRADGPVPPRPIRVVPAARLEEFVEGLTQALNDHGVPAMPSWREAIDWLAAHGGKR